MMFADSKGCPITSEVFILIKCLVILSLLLPIRVNAQEKEIEYEKGWEITSSENTLYQPNREIVDELAATYAENQLRIKTANNGRYSCVAWGKKLTGVYGVWGNGGHNLSLNSDGQIGDVVIFKGMHVAVVIARVGQNLTISEANYDWRGSIRTREINVYNSSIKGFHKF